MIAEVERGGTGVTERLAASDVAARQAPEELACHVGIVHREDNGRRPGDAGQVRARADARVPACPAPRVAVEVGGGEFKAQSVQVTGVQEE